MARETLDSDKINYLIWRYLIESDYKETAVRLQKEWNLPKPEELPFAPHVTHHALVSVLNKGLLYNTSERDTARTPRDVVAGPVSGFFGPLTLPQRPAPAPAPPANDAEDFENTRKHPFEEEQAPNQNGPAKRPRLSNGYENGFEPEPKSPMDVDEEPNADGNAYPSPEQLPSPMVVTNGPEKGTQVDKVSELTAETTFLDLSDDSPLKNTILLQCEFNPRDPTILAAAGTDALARMWTFSRTAADSDADMHIDRVSPPHHNLLSDGLPPNTTATGLSWSSDGLLIAIASEPMDGETARIEVWTREGTSIASFDSFESPVINLRWNFSNTRLLALSPEGQSALVTIMLPTTQDTLHFTVQGHALIDQTLDAAWMNDDEFVLCGGDFLRVFSCAEGEIKLVRKYETRDGHALSKVTFDWPSKLLATASDTGMIDIWGQQGLMHSYNAHQAVITSLAWQPLQTTAAFGDESERLLASAGEDGAISIWNARSSESKSRSSMTMGSGVVALAFTTDGAFIAGATGERILIWKVDDVNLPRASWVRGSEQGWQTPQSHDSGTDEDQHSLCWDANGQKLAYGVNALLAIINFRR